MFTDAWVPPRIDESVNMNSGEVTFPENIHVGGIGFFFEQAPDLPDEN